MARRRFVNPIKDKVEVRPDKASIYRMFMKILFSDAVRFLVEKSPDSRCQACGQDKWIVPFADNDKKYAFLTPLSVKFADQLAYNLALECANCGLVREHRARFVQEWIEANPVASSDE